MIIVAGSINLDLIASVPRLPTPGETLTGHDFKTAPGGKGANQALAAKRAGSGVCMIGAVGRDSHADEALSLLRGDGVDLQHVHPSDSPTGTALILVGADSGDNMIAVIPGANGDVSADEVSAVTMQQTDIALLQLEIPLAAVAAAITAAAQAGARSILNIAPWQEDAAPLCERCDILVANETEFDLAADALGLLGADRSTRMADYVTRFGKAVIVTLGEKGAIAKGPDFELSVPTIAIDAIDTVGAGDTFCGYLASLLEEGKPLEEALKMAAIAGALACTKEGAQPAIPYREAVDLSAQ